MEAEQCARSSEGWREGRWRAGPGLPGAQATGALSGRDRLYSQERMCREPGDFIFTDIKFSPSNIIFKPLLVVQVVLVWSTELS